MKKIFTLIAILGSSLLSASNHSDILSKIGIADGTKEAVVIIRHKATAKFLQEQAATSGTQRLIKGKVPANINNRSLADVKYIVRTAAGDTNKVTFTNVASGNNLQVSSIDNSTVQTLNTNTGDRESFMFDMANNQPSQKFTVSGKEVINRVHIRRSTVENYLSPVEEDDGQIKANYGSPSDNTKMFLIIMEVRIRTD